MRKLVFLSILLLLVGQANARPDGIGDVANDGCVCHGGSDDTVNISFVGLPDVYNSSEEYQITLVIESSVEENDVKGGFRILISEGELSGELQEIEEGLYSGRIINGREEEEEIYYTNELGLLTQNQYNQINS